MKSHKLWVIVSVSLILIVLVGFLAGYFYIKREAPHLFKFDKDVKERVVKLDISELDYFLVDSLGPVENIHVGNNYPDDAIYVGTLEGQLHEVKGQAWNRLRKTKTVPLGAMVLGIAVSATGNLYASVSDVDSIFWVEDGGYVVELDSNLHVVNKSVTLYPSNNGLAIDFTNNLYLATSNFNPFKPSGGVLKIDSSLTVSDTIIGDIGIANGVFYSKIDSALYLSNTFEGVYRYGINSKDLEQVYLKTRYKEITDEICLDASGNLWMTDPGNSTIKRYNMQTKDLTRYDIAGLGQISSCRIRMENGMPILYAGELKRSNKEKYMKFDGRGLWVLPLIQLMDR